MTSENFLKGTGKVDNTNGGYYCSLGDEVAEKVPRSHFPKLSELLMITVNVYRRSFFQNVLPVGAT